MNYGAIANFILISTLVVAVDIFLYRHFFRPKDNAVTSPGSSSAISNQPKKVGIVGTIIMFISRILTVALLTLEMFILPKYIFSWVSCEGNIVSPDISLVFQVLLILTTAFMLWKLMKKITTAQALVSVVILVTLTAAQIMIYMAHVFVICWNGY